MSILIIDTGVNSGATHKINLVPYESAIDYLNHGTVVAKIILAINPKAAITSIKITDRGGSTVNDKLAQALVYALSNPDISFINVSLGLPSYSQIIQDLINQLYARGTRIICAAGNNSKGYPALYDNTLPVGALNDDNTIASYSASANVYTYGTVTIDNKTYTGTSFSAAIITGILSKVSNR